MIIYKITNKINGKIYIGQTTRTAASRFTEHCTGSSKCRYLRHALDKYGRDSFSLEVIGTYASSQDLNLAEEYWIEYFQSLAPDGYNLQSGGYFGLPCGETKKLLSQKAKERKVSADTRKKISLRMAGAGNPRYGVRMSQETKDKIAAANRHPVYFGPKNDLRHGTEFKQACAARVTLRNHKQVIDLTSGIVFDSVKSLAASCGIPYSTLVSRLNGGLENNTRFRYVGSNAFQSILTAITQKQDKS